MGTRTYSRRRAGGQRVATPLGIQRALNNSTLKNDLYNAVPAMMRRAMGLVGTNEINIRDIQTMLPLLSPDEQATVRDILDEAKNDAQQALGVGVQQNLLDFLNDLGRDAGAPGFFDRVLRGEPQQTPQAIRETQQLQRDMTDIADRTADLTRQMLPDRIPSPVAQQVAQTLERAASAPRLDANVADELRGLARNMSPTFVERQNKRIIDGLNQLAALHSDVGRALGRGTNAGITEAIDRTSRVDTGLRTTIDTVLRGATQQDMTLRRMRDLARAAAKPGFPESARQAVLETIRSVPYRQQEKVNRAAIRAIANIGNTGVLPSVLGVAQRRNLGGTKGIVENVTETQTGINRARQLAGSRTNYSKEIDSLVREIERASVVARSGR